MTLQDELSALRERLEDIRDRLDDQDERVERLQRREQRRKRDKMQRRGTAPEVKNGQPDDYVPHPVKDGLAVDGDYFGK